MQEAGVRAWDTDVVKRAALRLSCNSHTLAPRCGAIVVAQIRSLVDLVAVETKSAETALDGLIRSTDELRDTSCATKIAFGEPFEGIIAVAKQASPDLIVMGAHRKEMLRDIFVGTTLERVIRGGARPVLMVNIEPSGPYRRGLAAVDLSDSRGMRYKR